MYSSYKRQRILYYHEPCKSVCRLLKDERMTASRQGIRKFIVKYQETGAITQTPGCGRCSKITAEVRALVEQMRRDDETTAAQLHALLVREGYSMCLKTILRCRTELGWTFRGSSYCQLIRHVNKGLYNIAVTLSVTSFGRTSVQSKWNHTAAFVVESKGKLLAPNRGNVWLHQLECTCVCALHRHVVCVCM